jgi:septin family protein
MNWPDEKMTVADHGPSADGSASQTTPGKMAALSTASANQSRHLEAAYMALARGNHTAAALELALASGSDKPLPQFETVYLTALLHADPGNPAGDMEVAHETLQRIAKEYPGSERAGEVRILYGFLNRMQSLQAENQTLHEEIDGMKRKLAAEQSSVQRLKRLLNKMKEIDLGLMPEEP